VQALVRGLVQRLAQTTAMVRKQAQQSDKLKALVYLLQAWIESVPTDRSGGMSLPVARLMEFGKAALRLPPGEMEGLLRELKEAGVLELSSTSRGRQVVLERPAQLLPASGQQLLDLLRQGRRIDGLFDESLRLHVLQILVKPRAHPSREIVRETASGASREGARRPPRPRRRGDAPSRRPAPGGRPGHILRLNPA